MVEQSAVNRPVWGSSPSARAILSDSRGVWFISVALEATARWFESNLSDQFYFSKPFVVGCQIHYYLIDNNEWVRERETLKGICGAMKQ